MILPAGRGPRKGEIYFQARLVKERLQRWGMGEYRQLWNETVEMTRTPPRARRRRRTGEPEERVKSQQEKNEERSTKLAQEAQYSKALQSLTSEGMADPTGATLRDM